MEWHDAGGAADAESIHAIEIEGVPVLLATLDGSWVAVRDRCTHAGCAFSTDGEIDADVVICNCHGSEFSLRDGAVLRGPATQPLLTVPVREVEGRLELQL